MRIKRSDAHDYVKRAWICSVDLDLLVFELMSGKIIDK